MSLILALNSGSSSLKLGCYQPSFTAPAGEDLLLTGAAEGIGRAEGRLTLREAGGGPLLDQSHLTESQDEALDRLHAALTAHLKQPVVAVGHRIVHGGPRLREHQRITPSVLDQLHAAEDLAPLHIPQALKLIAKAGQLYPGVPQFACFDTTFHRTLPPAATHLPIPARLFAKGVQRYGFHGLSCESVMRRLRAGKGKPPARVIIAHLGNGSSLTAVQNGESIDTTMGLSPTGGIPMSSRSGDLDPGVLLYLLRTEKLTAESLETLLDKQSGLAGLSGGESDMQQLLRRLASGDPDATLAIDVFTTAILKTVGAYIALLGGLDLLVFTGGIGEHSQEIRNRVCDRLGKLPGGPPPTLVLPAQEELEIASHCRQLLRA